MDFRWGVRPVKNRSASAELSALTELDPTLDRTALHCGVECVLNGLSHERFYEWLLMKEFDLKRIVADMPFAQCHKIPL